MNLREKAISSVLWSATQTWGVRVISFLVMIALARLVVPEAFGLVAYATVFIAFAQIFVNQGFSDAIVQFSQLSREHLDTAFWASLLTGSILSLIGFFSAGVVADLFREPQLIPILRWLSPIFFLSALSSVQQAILRRELAFKSLTIRSLAANLFSSPVAVIMALKGYGVWSLVAKLVAVIMALKGYGVWSLVAKLLLAAMVNVVMLWRVSNWRPGFRLSIERFRELFVFGIHIVGGDFVDFLSVHSDDFLIGYFLGPVALGYYTLAYNLLIVTTDLLISVPNAVAFPMLSSLQADTASLKRAFRQVILLQSIVAFPIFLGIAALSSELIIQLYGTPWIASIPVLQLLMLIGIVRSATYIYSSVFRAAGKPSWRFWIYLLTAAMNVVSFAFVVRLGIVAVAASYVIVSYVLMPLYFLMIRNLIGVSIRSHVSQYGPAVISTVVMFAVVYESKLIIGEQMMLPIRLCILVLIGAAIYLLTLRFTHPPAYKQVVGVAQSVLGGFLLRQM
jgi:Membrane protein involved in the export of O-antigen and teichoic acid